MVGLEANASDRRVGEVKTQCCFRPYGVVCQTISMAGEAPSRAGHFAGQ